MKPADIPKYTYAMSLANTLVYICVCLPLSDTSSQCAEAGESAT
jgi:hypothetical protein